MLSLTDHRFRSSEVIVSTSSAAAEQVLVLSSWTISVGIPVSSAVF